MDNNTHSTHNVGVNQDPPQRIPCPTCGSLFTRRGLARHVSLKHSARPVTVDPLTKTTLVSMWTRDFQAALQRVRVIRIVPKSVRVLVAEGLTEVLQMVAARNDNESWLSLMAFAPVVLRLAARKGSGVSPAAAIRANLRAFRESKGFCNLPKPTAPNFKIKLLSKTAEADTARRASIKLSEGDITGAARLLCSADNFASGTDILAALQERHPPAPEGLLWPSRPDSGTPQSTTRQDVIAAVHSFPVSSAAGIDHLRPRHLRDLMAASLGGAADKLADALAAVVDILRWGNPPAELRPLLFGARLFALRKKDGSVRPIACSSSLRRIAAKVACKASREQISDALGSQQLGFAKPGGMEAAVHATRSFIDSRKSATALIKLDFRNAFNSLRRDHMLNMVREYAPELFHHAELAYREPSHLLYEQHIIQSATGIQQGDPLGPALFCLGIKNLVGSLSSPLNVWYLDDCVIAGDPIEVAMDVQKVIEYRKTSGLALNTSKCELFMSGVHRRDRDRITEEFRAILPDCKVVTESSLELLGSPLLPEGIEIALERHRERLWMMAERLRLVGSHRGLFLLQRSISACRIIHLLRTSNLIDSKALLQKFNDISIDILQSLLNLELNPDARLQTFLPVASGGLGLPDAVAIAGPAVISSMYKSANIVHSLIPPEAWNYFLSTREALSSKLSLGRDGPPEKPELQKQWSVRGHEERFQSLLSAAPNDTERARLLAVSRPGAGEWLHALPSHTVGTLLDDETTRICAGIRLGVRIVEPHTCGCGEPVGPSGRHGLNCANSAGRHPRHAAINETFARALRAAGWPCIREPPGLFRDDGRRPDGMTLTPFAKGRALVWDGTVTDSLTPSVVRHGASRAGYAVTLAEQNKLRKYADIQKTYEFSPLAFETLGGPGPLTKQLLHTISEKLVVASGDKRAGLFFLQRLSIDVQRGNATAVLGTMSRWSRPTLGT